MARPVPLLLQMQMQLAIHVAVDVTSISSSPSYDRQRGHSTPLPRRSTRRALQADDDCDTERHDTTGRPCHATPRHATPVTRRYVSEACTVDSDIQAVGFVWIGLAPYVRYRSCHACRVMSCQVM